MRLPGQDIPLPTGSQIGQNTAGSGSPTVRRCQAFLRTLGIEVAI